LRELGAARIDAERDDVHRLIGPRYRKLRARNERDV
jgi:hypothetical protein